MNNIVKSLLIAFVFVMLFFCQDCYAISQDFEFVIDTIGIPRYNVYGEEINEEIYQAYNVFAYADPLSMYKKTNRQRFKEVPNFGKWTKNGGIYQGGGIRGEYYILGTTYSGSAIDNVFFPVDAIPESTPNYWEFLSMEDALLSWQDRSIYKYPEQLEYMKKTVMLFDSDNFKIPPTGKMELKSYGLSAYSIGLDKARLNTASTWKTMGIISTKRMNSKGQIRNAIFATAPMSASADIQSFMNVENHFYIQETSNLVNIPIKFGASAIHLSDEAKPEHIKEICSVLYINGQEVGRVSDSKKTNITSEKIYEVLRNTYQNPGSYSINVKVISYLYTEFAVDGLLKDEVQKDVTIHIIPKKIVPVKNVELKLLSKSNQTFYVLPLIQTQTTSIKESLGIVEKSRKLALKIVWNQEEFFKENAKLKIRLNNQEIDYEILRQQPEYLVIKLVVDNVDNTLASWNYLRNQTNNYFKIDFKDIGKRIKEPNQLKILVSDEENTYDYLLKFDTIDEYTMNLNYIFNNGVINQEEINSCIKIEEWK